MRSEGYGSCPVCVCVCVSVSTATQQTGHTNGLSTVLALGVFSFVSKIAIAFPYLSMYERTVVGHLYTRNGLIFLIPSVDFIATAHRHARLQGSLWLSLQY